MASASGTECPLNLISGRRRISSVTCTAVSTDDDREGDCLRSFDCISEGKDIITSSNCNDIVSECGDTDAVLKSR